MERCELDERRRARGLELRHAARVIEPYGGDAGDVERLQIATMQIDLTDLVRRSREQDLTGLVPHGGTTTASLHTGHTSV